MALSCPDKIAQVRIVTDRIGDCIKNTDWNTSAAAINSLRERFQPRMNGAANFPLGTPLYLRVDGSVSSDPGDGCGFLVGTHAGNGCINTVSPIVCARMGQNVTGCERVSYDSDSASLLVDPNGSLIVMCPTDTGQIAPTMYVGSQSMITADQITITGDGTPTSPLVACCPTIVDSTIALADLDRPSNPLAPSIAYDPSTCSIVGLWNPLTDNGDTTFGAWTDSLGRPKLVFEEVWQSNVITGGEAIVDQIITTLSISVTNPYSCPIQMDWFVPPPSTHFITVADDAALTLRIVTDQDGTDLNNLGLSNTYALRFPSAGDQGEAPTLPTRRYIVTIPAGTTSVLTSSILTTIPVGGTYPVEFGSVIFEEERSTAVQL